VNQESPAPQINVSKIPGGGGIAGALFAFGSMLIFLIGIPRLRFFLLAAIVLGGGVAVILRFVRHETPGKPWILSDAQVSDNASSAARAADYPPENLRRKLQALAPA
jgi:hypothetical protein